MQTRTTNTEVTFQRPFRLSGLDTAQPPGKYAVTVEEEQLDTTLSLAWRQVSATLQMARDGAIQHISVDPQELRDALQRDAEPLSAAKEAPATALRKRHTLHLPT